MIVNLYTPCYCYLLSKNILFISFALNSAKGLFFRQGLVVKKLSGSFRCFSTILVAMQLSPFEFQTRNTLYAWIPSLSISSLLIISLIQYLQHLDQCFKVKCALLYFNALLLHCSSSWSSATIPPFLNSSYILSMHFYKMLELSFCLSIVNIH